MSAVTVDERYWVARWTFVRFFEQPLSPPTSLTNLIMQGEPFVAIYDGTTAFDTCIEEMPVLGHRYPKNGDLVVAEAHLTRYRLKDASAPTPAPKRSKKEWNDVPWVTWRSQFELQSVTVLKAKPSVEAEDRLRI